MENSFFCLRSLNYYAFRINNIHWCLNENFLFAQNCKGITIYIASFTTTGVYSTNFDIIFDNIKFPYSLDLPYYSVSLIDHNGALDGYNEFINQNQNIFYTGVMKAFDVTCHDNSLGVTNTFCTLDFTTFQDIEIGSILVANLFGM